MGGSGGVEELAGCARVGGSVGGLAGGLAGG